MKPSAAMSDKVEDASTPVERGYAAWKQAKVDRGLAEAMDRDCMIPVEQILRDLQLER